MPEAVVLLRCVPGAPICAHSRQACFCHHPSRAPGAVRNAPIAQPAELLLPGRVPAVEANLAAVGGEVEGLDLHADCGLVLLLELARDVPLDEGRLACGHRGCACQRRRAGERGEQGLAPSHSVELSAAGTPRTRAPRAGAGRACPHRRRPAMRQPRRGNSRGCRGGARRWLDCGRRRPGRRRARARALLPPTYPCRRRPR